MKIARFLLLAALPALLAAGTARAQPASPFPVRTVKLVVPAGAGGPTDVVARVLANGLTESWGKQVLVENRPGAGGNPGAEVVVRSAPDGHTLLLGSAGPIVINMSLYPNLRVDPRRELAPISQLTSVPMVLFVAPETPAKTLAELVRHVKERPGKLNYASTGIGTMPHLAGELLKRQAGLDLVQVPYKAVPAAVAALMAGEVVAFFDTPTGFANARAGKLRALAVAAKTRFSGAPEVPTTAEAGYPGLLADSWYGLLAPLHTPRDLRLKVHADVAKVLLAPETKSRLASLGFDVVASAPDAFADTIASESERWASFVRTLGIRME